MNKKIKFIIILIISIVIIIISIGIGSVPIPPLTSIKILLNKIFNFPYQNTDANQVSILWNLRLPRTLLAFISGGGLAVSGVIMQSIMRNPLASSYTLGVSSGAAVGASIAILFGISIFKAFTLPVFGLAFGLLTVFSAIALASRLDKNMESTTIILTGMALSLFANAVLTIIMVFAKQELQRLVFWQLGNFASKGWSGPGILFPIVIVLTLIAFRYGSEMDIMTFGEDQAKVSGVEMEKLKIILLSIGSIMTGVIVSIVGIIGFLDLFTPHVARRIFGSKQTFVVPASFFLGGCFMVLCDLIARVAVSSIDLPVGAVTALIGAPFFIYLYFSKRKVR
ncbi:MAG: iron ABC transporter permease [Oscillospiraceae bacterium]|nr:iron ABC transporter permease [Oscillospiraceae bacterium]